jgi:hypothetical protein
MENKELTTKQQISKSRARKRKLNNKIKNLKIELHITETEIIDLEKEISLLESKAFEQGFMAYADEPTKKQMAEAFAKMTSSNIGMKEIVLALNSKSPKALQDIRKKMVETISKDYTKQTEITVNEVEKDS